MGDGRGGAVNVHKSSKGGSTEKFGNHGFPTMLCLEDERQMSPFNDPFAHINHLSIRPCEPQKGRQDENLLDLSRTKLIIQLLLSESLCCPDKLRAIYNRLATALLR